MVSYGTQNQQIERNKASNMTESSLRRSSRRSKKRAYDVGDTVEIVTATAKVNEIVVAVGIRESVRLLMNSSLSSSLRMERIVS